MRGNLGVMLKKGMGGPADRERARALFEKACKAEVERACENLELMADPDHGKLSGEAVLGGDS